MSTDYPGIDYGMGRANVDDNGIRYGVIPQNDVLQAWADSSEPDYGTPSEPVECPECGHSGEVPENWGDTFVCEECDHEWDCELPDFAESLGFYLDDGEYKATCDDDGDIFILASPYYTFAQFCSPCAPGACHLRNPLAIESVHRLGHPRAYCLGPDWFDDDNPCPYPVWEVSTSKLIYSPE